MKKTVLTTLMLLAICLTVGAQNVIAIYQNDGKVANFAFSEKPVVTYADNQLVITTTKTSVQYPLYLLQKIDFVESEATAIEKVKNEAKFRFTDGTLYISGGDSGSQVYIYNMRGMKVGDYRLDAQGCASIPLSSLRSDIYIVKAKDFTFKFRKS